MHTKLYSEYFKEFQTFPDRQIEPVFVGARRFPIEILYLDHLSRDEYPTLFPKPILIGNEVNSISNELLHSDCMHKNNISVRLCSLILT